MTTRPALLFLSQQAPWPEDSGGNQRSAAILRGLSEGFDVTLVACEPPGGRRAEAERALAGSCARAVLTPDAKRRGVTGLANTAAWSFLRSSPMLIEHNLNPALLEQARSLLDSGRFQSVHLNHIDTAPAVEGRDAPPFVIDTHNLYFESFARQAERAGNPLKRAILARDARLLRRYELRVFRRAAGVLVCSERERRELLALDPALDVTTVPNGADCARSRPSAGDPFENLPALAFVGDMAYGPNDDAARWFVAEVLPLLRTEVPGVRFLAVGKNPSEALRRLGDEHADVVVTGFVEDVTAVLARARAVVVPLRYGAGTRLKVLEALALGIPTVSTPLGAEGIELEDGEEILLADGPASLAAACARVLTDRALHARLRRAGRRAAEERYDWRALAERARAVHERLSRTR